MPTEQTKLSTAMIGPTITFSIVRTAAGAFSMNSPLKKSLPRRPMKPARRKPIEISFHSIVQSARKLWATSDQASTLVTRSRQGIPSEAAASC